MALKTLVTLRTESRQKSNNEDDGNFISDVELNGYVNEGISELYDVMIDGDTEALFSVNSPILQRVGENAYLLPDNFYRMVSLSLKEGGRYINGRPGDVLDIARLSADPPATRNFQYFLRFNMVSGQRFLFIYPQVDENNLALVYVPEAPVLGLDTDTFFGPNNWHEYVTVTAAIKMNAKQEQDTGPLRSQRRDLENRVKEHIREMDVGIPPTIREVHQGGFEPFHDYHPRTY